MCLQYINNLIIFLQKSTGCGNSMFPALLQYYFSKGDILLPLPVHLKIIQFFKTLEFQLTVVLEISWISKTYKNHYISQIT